MDRARRVVNELRALADPRIVEGMLRFAVRPRSEMLGIAVPTLRRIARGHRNDHDLALALWGTGIHEARHLAAMVDDPARVTKRQMQDWAKDFDSWDIVDGCCYGLFDRTRHALEMAHRFAGRKPEFEKRAGFSMMAGLAVHDKTMSDETFLELLPVIEREAWDDRNFVRKAVNWALRQIGKRNLELNAAAIDSAERIRAGGTRAGRWIASDALRELRGEPVQRRLGASTR